jgi:DNA (cytosine-5)-methyltransferase 1
VTPRLLDLFCGAGGASVGYARAGFEVVGVDLGAQPRYPFRFVRADAMAVLRGEVPEVDLSTFDAVHASPPCQAYSIATAWHPGVAETHPDLVDDVRDALEALGVPYAIENVVTSPLRNALRLCGTQFEGLRVYRHRLFECSPPLYFAPASHGWHRYKPPQVGRRAEEHGWVTVAGHIASLDVARAAMGIDWMTRDELVEAIPPAYTEYVGRHLLAAVREREEANCA